MVWKFFPELIPYQTLFVKPLYQVYNKDMSPRHFANYAKNQPQQYQAFSNAMWNTFVVATHTVGLSKFFSFTPEYKDVKDQPK